MKNTPAIRRALLAWFYADARDLPWRKTTDPYKIWVSEIILQQTRVDQGLPYYERFIAAFPTVQALAKARQDRVLKLWEGLGYYTRARNMHKAAKQITAQYHGHLPRQAEVLALLPGIGRYTAGAIASIAFGERTPVVDGNVKRVLARLFNLDACVDEPAVEKELWRIAETLVPPQHPGDFNQSMMELGARICTPRKPLCEACPVAACCAAQQLGLQEERPVRRAKKETPHYEIVVAAIHQDGRYLIGKRPSEGLLGGLWEFPGGKVRTGESHQEALKRECKEELGITVRAGGLVATVNHAYSHFRVTLNVYRCALTGSVEPRPRTHTELKWVTPKEFSKFSFPAANHKFIPLL